VPLWVEAVLPCTPLGCVLQRDFHDLCSFLRPHANRRGTASQRLIHSMLQVLQARQDQDIPRRIAHTQRYSAKVRCCWEGDPVLALIGRKKAPEPGLFIWVSVPGMRPEPYTIQWEGSQWSGSPGRTPVSQR
jgi:hypothetical protein